jgi:hypothetical protein
MAETGIGIDAVSIKFRYTKPYKSPKLLGYIPAPKCPEFCGLALVYECPECYTKYWTHYCWVGLDKEMLSDEAISLLEHSECK